jgi:tRNA A37 methylthiotransferase MiaB
MRILTSCLQFVREVEFDRMGVFTYSDEEGTHGFELDEKVSPRIMRSRRAKLMREQARISKKKNRALVGQKFRALLEGYFRGDRSAASGSARVTGSRCGWSRPDQ